MRKTILLSVLLLVTCPIIGAAQNDPDFNLKALATDLEKRFEACPRREVVAPFDRKHHKQIWEKSGWGPPVQVFADAKPNDSILYPYIVMVEFYLSFTYGPERQSKAEAESDSNLSPLGLPLAAAQGGRYRNIYLVGRDGLRLKAREFLESQSDGAGGVWKERPLWPDACWDQIK